MERTYAIHTSTNFNTIKISVLVNIGWLSFLFYRSFEFVTIIFVVITTNRSKEKNCCHNRHRSKLRCFDLVKNAILLLLSEQRRFIFISFHDLIMRHDESKFYWWLHLDRSSPNVPIRTKHILAKSHFFLQKKTFKIYFFADSANV